VCLSNHYQYQLAKFNEQLKRDSYEAERLNARLEKAEQDYNAGNITAQEYNSVAFRVCTPYQCTLDGLPKYSSKKGFITSAASGARGVVAL